MRSVRYVTIAGTRIFLVAGYIGLSLSELARLVAMNGWPRNFPSLLFYAGAGVEFEAD